MVYLLCFSKYKTISSLGLNKESSYYLIVPISWLKIPLISLISLFILFHDVSAQGDKKICVRILHIICYNCLYLQLLI